MLKGNQDVDEIILFPRQKFRGAAGLIPSLRWCKQTMVGRRPDVALDFQGLLRSAFLGRLSGAGVFYGMADAREGSHWLYDQVAPVPAGVPHAVDRYLMLAEAVLRSAGGDGHLSSRSELEFPLPVGDAPAETADLLAGDFMLLHPFARGVGKSLTAGQVAAFCQRLAPRRVVMVGRRGNIRFDVPDIAIDLLDRTSLLQLIWVIRRASAVISVDSGPAHLAAALGRSLVAIHTWSDPRRVGPYRQDAWVWKSGRLLPVSQLSSQEEAFFHQIPTPLSVLDIDEICTLAISLSDSCA